MPERCFDVDAFLAMPRLANLHVSPDGSRLALTVQAVATDGRSFVGAVWEVDAAGDAPPRLLLNPERGATARGFLPDGSLLFSAPRGAVEAEAGVPPDPGAAAAAQAEVLHLLPAGGGKPVPVFAPDAGVGAVVTARASSTVVVTAALHVRARRGRGTRAGTPRRRRQRTPRRPLSRPLLGPRHRTAPAPAFRPRARSRNAAASARPHPDPSLGGVVRGRRVLPL